MNRRFTFDTSHSNANDRYWDVYLDGQLLHGCRATEESQRFTMTVESAESWKILKSVDCAQCVQFEKIYTFGTPDLGAFVDGQSVILQADESSGLKQVVVRLGINPGTWTNPWSIDTFIASIKNAMETNPSRWQCLKADGYNRYGFDFNFILPISEPKSTLGNITKTATTIVRELLESVSRELQGTSFLPQSTSASPNFRSSGNDETAGHNNVAGSATSRGLVVFLCHASEDKDSARYLYNRLLNDGFDPWLDETNLLPGQEWQVEIPRAVRRSDIVVVCLSKRSIDKTGYVQREIRIALDAADERPEGSVYIIPIRIEPCKVPERLSRWQWVDIFAENGYDRLSLALNSVSQK